jgi:ribosomal protein L17
MMRHVANGGRPHDEFGQHIVSTSEDIAKLNSFSRYVTNKDQLNDNAGDIIEQTKLKLENLRGYMKNLSNQSHYENASKDFKTSEEQILDDETVNKLREKFTMKNLDNRVEDALPLINRIMSELEAPKEEEQVNELEPDAEPIDAPVQAPVDHGAVVQSFLNDPDSKLVLRKDDSADKMLKVTKFTNKNTMLSSILSDIASRLLTKTGEEDRVANFASRVADEMEQENSATFKPTPDYIKNKKIAVQLAKRYIDDYKKMQSEPGYTDQVRMDPADFNPKKDLKGKAKETEAFESWVEETVNEYTTGHKDPEIEKKDKENATKLDVTKADKMMNTPAYQKMKSGDPKYADKTEGMGDKIADMAQSMSRDEFMGKADELGLTPEEAAEHYEKMQGGAHAGKFEGNQFAQAVQKAKAAGMKAGDKFKVGDDEYTLKDAIEMAGLDLNEFYSEEEIAYDNQIDRIKNLALYQ